MSSIDIENLFGDNKEILKLSWSSKFYKKNFKLSEKDLLKSKQGLVGHLNSIHPNWIQIFSKIETSYLKKLEIDDQEDFFKRLSKSGLFCLICSDNVTLPKKLEEFLLKNKVPIIKSPLSSLHIIWVLRTYLTRKLANSISKHGVFLDVLGMGVLIQGDSGVGKSELALELISRGSGLVADDVVDLYQIGPESIEGRSPELLKDYIEVRGLGILNMKTIFGETAVRRRKGLKLIVHLEKPNKYSRNNSNRLSNISSYISILGVKIKKVSLPVMAGRNLAVLIEAAVRNYILQLRGIDSTNEFVQKQELFVSKNNKI